MAVPAHDTRDFDFAKKFGIDIIQVIEGHWRLLLTRRITDLRVVDYMKAIQTAPPLYNGELQAGSGKWGTMSSVIMTAKW